MISYPDPQHCEATSQPGYIVNRIYIRNAKYRKVLALLAFIFGSSFEEIKGNKSLTIPSKRQCKCDQFVYQKDKCNLIL